MTQRIKRRRASSTAKDNRNRLQCFLDAHSEEALIEVAAYDAEHNTGINFATRCQQEIAQHSGFHSGSLYENKLDLGSAIVKYGGSLAAYNARVAKCDAQ